MTLEELLQTRIDQFNKVMQEYLKREKPCTETQSEQG